MGKKERPLESVIQARIIKRMEAQGYYVIKLQLTNKNGIPDLLCLKDGKASFIEVKRPGEKPRALQEYRHKELVNNGFEVFVINEI
jgi:Holliday junction resolvase